MARFKLFPRYRRPSPALRRRSPPVVQLFPHDSSDQPSRRSAFTSAALPPTSNKLEHLCYSSSIPSLPHQGYHEAILPTRLG